MDAADVEGVFAQVQPVMLEHWLTLAVKPGAAEGSFSDVHFVPHNNKNLIIYIPRPEWSFHTLLRLDTHRRDEALAVLLHTH